MSTLKVGAIQSTTGNAAITVANDGSLTTTQKVATSNLGTGAVLQVLNSTVNSADTSSSSIAADDSRPLPTEGLEVTTLAITPKSASSKLLIQVVVMGSSSSDAVTTIALFQDSGTHALGAVTAYQSTGTGTQTLSFNHFMTAGTTNATTFKVRAGANTGTFTLNGYSGNRMVGGVSSSSITIMEIGG